MIINLLLISLLLFCYVNGQLYNPLTLNPPPPLPPASSNAFPSDIDNKLSLLDKQLHNIGGIAAKPDLIVSQVDSALNFDSGPPNMNMAPSLTLSDSKPQPLPHNVVADANKFLALKNKYMKEAMEAKKQRDEALAQASKILGVENQFIKGGHISMASSNNNNNNNMNGDLAAHMTKKETQFDKCGNKKKTTTTHVDMVHEGCDEDTDIEVNVHLPVGLQPPNIPAFPGSNNLDKQVQNMLSATMNRPQTVSSGSNTRPLPIAPGKLPPKLPNQAQASNDKSNNDWIHPQQVDRGLVGQANSMVVLPKHTQLEYRTGSSEVDTQDYKQSMKSVIASTEQGATKLPFPNAVQASDAIHATPSSHNLPSSKQQVPPTNNPPPTNPSASTKAKKNMKPPAQINQPPLAADNKLPTPIPPRFREVLNNKDTPINTNVNNDRIDLQERNHMALEQMRNATVVIGNLLTRIQKLEAMAMNKKDAKIKTPQITHSDGTLNLEEIMNAQKDLNLIENAVAKIQKDNKQENQRNGKLVTKTKSMKADNDQLKNGVTTAVGRIKTLMKKLDTIATDRDVLMKEKQVLVNERNTALTQVKNAQQQISKLLKLMEDTHAHFQEKATTMAKAKSLGSQLEAQTAIAAVTQVKKAHDVIAASSQQINNVAKELQNANKVDDVSLKKERDKIHKQIADKNEAMTKVNKAANVIQNLLGKLHDVQQKQNEMEEKQKQQTVAALPPPPPPPLPKAGLPKPADKPVGLNMRFRESNTIANKSPDKHVSISVVGPAPHVPNAPPVADNYLSKVATTSDDNNNNNNVKTNNDNIIENSNVVEADSIGLVTPKSNEINNIVGNSRDTHITHHHHEDWKREDGKRIHKQDIIDRHINRDSNGNKKKDVTTKNSEEISLKNSHKQPQETRNQRIREFAKLPNQRIKKHKLKIKKSFSQHHKHYTQHKKKHHHKNKHHHKKRKSKSALKSWYEKWENDWNGNLETLHKNHKLKKHHNKKQKLTKKLTAAERIIKIAHNKASDPVAKFIHLLDELQILPISNPTTEISTTSTDKKSKQNMMNLAGIIPGAVVKGNKHDYMPLRVPITKTKSSKLQNSAVNAATSVLRMLEETETQLLMAKGKVNVNAALNAHLSSGRAGLALLKRIKGYVTTIKNAGLEQNNKKSRELQSMIGHLEMQSQRAVSVAITAHRERLMSDIAHAYSVIGDLEELSENAHTAAQKAAIENKARTAMLMLQDIQRRQRAMRKHGLDIVGLL